MSKPFNHVTPPLRGWTAASCVNGVAALLGIACCCLGCRSTKDQTPASLPAGAAVCAPAVKDQAQCPKAPAAAGEALAQKWGVQVSNPCLSAGGYLLDFRYKVLDPEKAAPLAKPECKPCLIDQATGARFMVPSNPNVGPLRQSSRNLAPGKIYFVLFANPAKYVKAGNKVTVVIGDFRAENLVVE